MWLNSSTPPISTRRWPSEGSKPVVSVSRTISRIGSVSGQFCDQVEHGGAGLIKTQRLDHMGGAGAFLGIRHLLGQDRLEMRLGHAGAGKDAGALDLGRG